MHYDLIIIGMGLSGLMAAQTASDANQKVLIVGKGMGGLALFSNTVDLLGDISEGVKWKDGLSRWIQDHPDHPYGKIGLEKIEESLSSFNSLFPPPYTFQSKNEANSLIPTGIGTFRPTFLIPSTLMRGITVREKKTLIIGFKGYKDFYAHRVADQLKCRGIVLSLPEKLQGEISATALARRMEQSSFREFIGAEVKKHLRDEELIGFPALLGIKAPTGVKKDLEKRIGASLFEIPVLPPSIPGMRIFNRFKERLIQKGVTFLQGYSVSKALFKGKRCVGVEISHPPVITLYSADHYILATGRFTGGGLKVDRNRISEPLFQLPVHQPGSQEEWFEKSFFEAHPMHRIGVLTDSSLRPMGEKGEPILENVRVVGTILAHQNWIEEKSREGIEIATGYWAARQALAQ